MSEIANDAGSGWWNSFNDTFKVLADGYVKVKAIENGNPMAYNQYAYGAITSQNNGATTMPYANAVQSQQAQISKGNNNFLMIVAFGLVAFVLLKKI